MLYPLSLSTDNSNVLENLREFSKWRITMSNMPKSLQIVDDTAEINFLQKSVTVLYYQAQLSYILKSFIYSFPRMSDLKMRFIKMVG